MAEEGHDHRDQDINPSFEQSISRHATLAEADQVKQTLHNSSVNVVAGDQYVRGSAILADTANVDLRIIKSTFNVVSENLKYSGEVARGNFRTEREASRDISCTKLVKLCNNNTMKMTAIDILDDFRLEDLQEPNFNVYPQMQQVDVGDYYKGRYGNISFPWTRNVIDHNQLTKEVRFLRQDNIKAKMIDIDDLIASIWPREKLISFTPIGVTAIVGSAGSGKSTLTRRIARQALGMSRMEFEDIPSNSSKMVVYIELKDIENASKITPSKFLFGAIYQTEEEQHEAFEWLDKHQSEAILIFDGLDETWWDYSYERVRRIRKYERASSETVMYNILSRNILRHVKVFIASKEFKISELPAIALPETIIMLNGLTLDDTHRIFVFLLKEEGEALWHKIEVMSPRLLNLVSVPVFLILTAVVMVRDPTRPPPATVTELCNRIVLALQSVDNIRNREHILSIINKLKALAFRGMEEGRVMFKETDLREFGVSVEEVQDLMTKVPGNNLLSRHLMQGSSMFFFCHQSLQEYLAAVFVAEMGFNEFCRFNEEHLHEERWFVVRRFVSGVVFSKPQNDLYEVSDQTRKRDVLARSILSRLQAYTYKSVRMEAYTAIYESGDDNLMKDLSVIDASHISLSRDEAHVVGSLAARNGSLDSFTLPACHIDDELLIIISRCMQNPIHVKKVDLRGNKFSATALRSLLGHRRIESLTGNLAWEVVLLTTDGYDHILKNKEDVIEIIGVDAGYFNIKESTLSFEYIHSLPSATFFELLFEAEFHLGDKSRQVTRRQSFVVPEMIPSSSKSTAEQGIKVAERAEEQRSPLQGCIEHLSDEVTAQIGREEKTIEINGCSITFPKGSFDETKQVSVKADINPEIWPRDSIGITPTLHVIAPVLKIPAKVKLTTWCITDPDDDEDAMVEVLRFVGDTNHYEVVHRCPLGNSREIKFEIGQFSKVFGKIMNSIRRITILASCIYYNGRQFAVATLLADERARKKCLKKIEEEIGTTEGVHTYGPLPWKNSHPIRSKIFCEDPPDAFRFTPTEFDHTTREVEVGISREFFPILKGNETATDITVRFQLLDYGLPRHDNCFTYRWRPVSATTNPVRADPSKIPSTRDKDGEMDEITEDNELQRNLKSGLSREKDCIGSIIEGQPLETSSRQMKINNPTQETETQPCDPNSKLVGQGVIESDTGDKSAASHGNDTSEQTSETASGQEISPAVVNIIVHNVHSTIGTLVEKGGKFKQHGEKNNTFIGASQQDIKKNIQVTNSGSE